jgi:hypothetical protein
VQKFILTVLITIVAIPSLCACGTAAVATPIPTPTEISTSEPPPTLETPAWSPSTISVPQGAPSKLDGVMEPSEWEAAAVETFSDGSQLYLMHKDGYLYLGVRSITPEMIAGNVFVESGGEIAILHTSAALGTAVYGAGNEDWNRSRDFTWRCRSTGGSESAVAERETFLEQEGWLASNSRMGNPAELEYKIEVPEGVWRLAVVILRASDPNTKYAWPVDLDDDCVLPTPGGMPAQLRFEPETWASLELVD